MRYTISFALASLLAGSALAETPRVVTDIPPVQALVAQVMGDLGTPVLLLAKGADEHDFALKPSQMAEITGADLAVWVGPGLTPWLERALQGSAAQSLALLDAEGTLRRAAPEEGHDEAQPEEDHDEGTQAEAAHDHGPTDPHAWLDPQNAALWTGMIAAELARLDPANAATYAANARAAQARLAALEAEIAAQLAPLADRPFVTYHDAYGYFTARFGLTPAMAVAMGDASAPGAAHLAELQAQIAAGGAVCLFPEAQHDPALLEQLAGPARIGGALDPVGAMLDPGPGAYDSLLRGLASTLHDCLKG